MSRGGFRRSQKGRACLRRADFRVFSPGIVFEAGDERPNLEKMRIPNRTDRTFVKKRRGEDRREFGYTGYSTIPGVQLTFPRRG